MNSHPTRGRRGGSFPVWHVHSGLIDSYREAPMPETLTC